MRLNIAVFLK